MAYRALICLFFGLLLNPLLSFGSVVVTPAVSGYSGGMYVGPGVASAASFNSPAIVNVGGRAATFPASMRFAANSGRYAIAAARMSPALLATGAIAAWLAIYGLEWVTDHWVKKTTVAEKRMYYRISGGQKVCVYEGIGTTCSCHAASGAIYPGYTSGCSSSDPAVPKYSYWVRTSGGVTSNYSVEPVPFDVIPPSQASAPATDADFNAVPDPMPDAVADQLKNNNIPIPVSPPEFAPVDAPMGDPYKKPDGSTVQPRVQISPNPSSPGTVTVDTYDAPVSNPDGSPAASGSPVQDTPEPPKDPCDDHPDRVGCADLGTPDSDIPKTQNNVFSYTPEAAAFSGSCPASISVLGRSLSFQPACDAMGLIKPIILGLASLMAGYILIGAFRET